MVCVWGNLLLVDMTDSNTSKYYRNSAEDRQILVSTSIRRADQLDLQVKRATVPIRTAFVVSPRAETPPPMTELLRGGRGGEVKLKLLLSMIWVAAAEPFDVTLPARVWAELIGLPDAETGGAARVSAAVRRLVKDGYVASDARPGMPSRLMLQEETGTGNPYSHPGSHWDKTSTSRPQDRPTYLQLPKELWTKGWLSLLSGPATAMLLALIEQTRGRKYEGIWFSPSVADRRYGLTEVTRKKGLTLLRDLGLITVSRRSVARNTLGPTRFRNTYAVDLDRMKIYTPLDAPPIPAPERPSFGVTEFNDIVARLNSSDKSF